MLQFPAINPRRTERVLADDRVDPNQYQPIHLAALEGNVELAKLHLDQGANVNAQVNKSGHFPLYFATVNRNPAVLKTLLDYGANVNQRTILEGRTALHEACRNSDEESIKILMSDGADMLIQDNDGRTPFAILNKRRNMKNPIFRLMIKLLALRKVCLHESPMELYDERMLKEYPLVLWLYYLDCIKHVQKMKSTRITENCTFFQLLTKSHREVAALMRNPRFGANFELYDLNEFAMYAEDLARAFESAQNYFNSMLDQEDGINEDVDVTNDQILCTQFQCTIS